MAMQGKNIMPLLGVAMNLRKGLMGHRENVRECRQQGACLLSAELECLKKMGMVLGGSKAKGRAMLLKCSKDQTYPGCSADCSFLDSGILV